jgi:hypothetical protein
MALLGLLTRIGVTTEATARWHEIHVSPEQADIVGLLIVAVGAVVLATGWVLSKTNKRGE